MKKSDLTAADGAGRATRRTFLKQTMAATVATALPGLAFAARAKKAQAEPKLAPPSERVNVACCGIGARGADDVNSLYSTGLANIVALCDTDMGASQTQGILKKFPNVPRFQDFRVMLDKMGKQIDAVTAGVPDHAHFPIAMLAMSLGKHVYVEKPMGHTFREVELMMQAERKYKVAAQMGNQGHSGANYFQFKAWVEAGIIKNVTRIVAHMNSARRWHPWGVVQTLPPAEPVPASLDWDTWLVQVPFHDYNRKYVHGDWRCWYDFGNGALGDWGAHILDTAHEFLKLGLPTEVAAVKLEGHSPVIFPQSSTLSFKFAARDGLPPVQVLWYDGVHNLPPLPSDFGKGVYSADVPPPTSGKLDASLPPGKEIYADGIVFKGGSHSSTLQIVSKEQQETLTGKLPAYPSGSDHFKNFLLACKGAEQCRSSFAVAGPLSQVLVLGVLAQKLNAKLAFDPATRQITNHPVANELLAGPPPRKGWEQYYKL